MSEPTSTTPVWFELLVRVLIAGALSGLLEMADRAWFGLDWAYWIWAIIAVIVVFVGSIIIIAVDDGGLFD